MKIFCIEGNYQSEKDQEQEPVFIIKPETCLLRNNHPFFIPEHSDKIIPNIHLVVRISRLGKNVQEKFAHLYYNEVGVGADMVSFDALEFCKKNGLPWETARSYDFSSPLGNFDSLSNFPDINNIPFSLVINDKVIIETNTSSMIHGINKIIEHISKYTMLKMGDLIYTGSPVINQKVSLNDRVEGYLGEKKMLWFNIK